MTVYVIEEVLLKEGALFDKKLHEVWTDKDKAWKRYEKLNEQHNEEGISYNITAIEVKS